MVAVLEFIQSFGGCLHSRMASPNSLVVLVLDKRISCLLASLYLQLTDKKIADDELPITNFYKSIIKFMGNYQKEYDALYNLHGRGYEFQKAVDASDELSKQVDLIDQKAQRLNIFIEEQRSIAIEQLEPFNGGVGIIQNVDNKNITY
jgi:hypothetical protein